MPASERFTTCLPLDLWLTELIPHATQILIYHSIVSRYAAWYNHIERLPF